jgi:hypothetical protein
MNIPIFGMIIAMKYIIDKKMKTNAVQGKNKIKDLFEN